MKTRNVGSIDGLSILQIECQRCWFMFAPEDVIAI